MLFKCLNWLYTKIKKGNIMKFAHLADTHLGYRQFGLYEREKDFYEVFEKIISPIVQTRRFSPCIMLPAPITEAKVSSGIFAVISESMNTIFPIDLHNEPIPIAAAKLDRLL